MNDDSGSTPSDTDIDQHWDYNDPAATEVRFAELLPTIRASGDVDLHAQLLTQIARTHSLRRQFDESHRILDQVEPMLSDDTPIARVRLLLERGRAFNSANEPAVALPLFEQAWKLVGEEDAEFHAVDAAHMLGIVAPPDDALRWNLLAIEHAECAADPRARKWLGPLYNNTGWTLHDQGDLASALDLFQKALARYSEGDAERPIDIARWTVARCFRSMQRYDEALAIQRQLELKQEQSESPDGYVYEEIGELLLAKGLSADARPYFARAHELLSADEWLQANEAPRLERLAELADT